MGVEKLQSINGDSTSKLHSPRISPRPLAPRPTLPRPDTSPELSGFGDVERQIRKLGYPVAPPRTARSTPATPRRRLNQADNAARKKRNAVPATARELSSRQSTAPGNDATVQFTSDAPGQLIEELQGVAGMPTARITGTDYRTWSYSRSDSTAFSTRCNKFKLLIAYTRVNVIY